MQASWALHEFGELAGTLLGIFIVLLLVSFLVWRMVARHRATMRGSWDRFAAHPQVRLLRRRYASPLAFVAARLSPQGYLGLHLTVGALMLTGASWLFGGIAEEVVNGEPLTLVDVAVANWLHANGSAPVTAFLRNVTELHGTVAMICYVVFLFAFLYWKREFFWARTLLLAVPGGMLLNVLIKHAFQRARPTFDAPLLTLTTYSFPSGHAVASTLLYGFLALFIVSRKSAWSRRLPTIAIALAMIVLVAFSRMYLGVHYLSDVLAGIVEGVAWLSLCVTGLRTYEQHRFEGREQGLR